MPSTISSPITILERQDCFQSGFLPPDLLTHGHLLMLSPHSKGGLFIRKPFYTDFAGPGSALGCGVDSSATAVYVVGTVQILVPTDLSDRQQAYRFRIAYSDRIAQVTRDVDPVHRARLLVNYLCQWVGVDAARQIPSDWLAQVVGVHPQRLQAAWGNQWTSRQSLRSSASGPQAVAPDRAPVPVLSA